LIYFNAKDAKEAKGIDAKNVMYDKITNRRFLWHRIVSCCERVLAMPAFRVKINPAMLLPEPNILLIYATIKIGG